MQQEPVQGMGWRYVLFIVASTAIMGGYVWWQQGHLKPKQPARIAKAQAAAKTENADAKKTDAKKADATSSAEKSSIGPAKAAAKTTPDATPSDKPGSAKPGSAKPGQSKSAVPETKAPDRLVTLGSVDPEGPYRMLATLTARGAGVQRIELSSPRFHDLEDRSGYLGHLFGNESAAGADGCVVQVVGAGTPAAEAGLEPGDTIQRLGNTKIADAATFREALSKTKPKQTVVLTVLRKGDKVAHEHEVTLRRRPLEVIRPSAGAPPSFLLTLFQVGAEEALPWSRSAGEDEDPEEADRRLPDHELEGVSLRKENWEVESHGAAHVTFLRNVPKYELKVRKTFRLEPVPLDQQKNADYRGYHLNLVVEIEHGGKTEQTVAYQLEGPNGLPIEGGWYAQKVQGGLRDVWGAFTQGSPVFLSCLDIAKATDSPIKREDPMRVLAGDAQYFVSAIVAGDDGMPLSYWQALYYGKVEKGLENLTNTSFRMAGTPQTLSAKEPVLRNEFELFAGPRRPDLLAQYGMGEIIDYGWFTWVAKVLLAVLHTVYKVIPNYGIAIVVLTVLVRLCMFPISRKQALSAQKMQVVQPELKKIQEKYKNDLEARGRAMRELYKKHNFHPMGGCLLLFLQLPIFVGLYRALMVDVELRQAPLIAESIRWASNLASPDMLLDWRGFMPEYVTAGVGFFGLGPYFNILPILTVVLFLWQQQKMMPPAMDEQAAMQQKMMKYMMVFMGLMFYKVASGLCLYFIVSSLWSVGERKFLPKSVAGTAGTPTSPSSPSILSLARDDAAKKKKRKNRRR